MNNKMLSIIVIAIILAGCVIGSAIYLVNTHQDDKYTTNNTTDKTNSTVNFTEDSENEQSSSSQSNSEKSSSGQSNVQASYSEGSGPTDSSQCKGQNPYYENEILPNGWNPKEHEVSRENMEEGYHKIHYDDNYFRICDSYGKVVTYGYG